MKVLIDARVEPGVNGGIEQALIGLVECMNLRAQPNTEITWLALNSNYEFIKSRISDNQQVLLIEPENLSTRGIATFLRKSGPGRKLLRFLRQYGPFRYELPNAPDAVKQINPDVVHFPLQFGFKTSIPSVYQPHDLQHLHFPEFFSDETLYLRNKVYADMMMQASIIAVGNDWTVNDVREKYPQYSGKVRNVPVNPQTLNINDAAVMENLPKPFLYYPAAFWPHKNHDVVFRSLGELKTKGIFLNLVLTGAVTNRKTEILEMAKTYGVTDQIHILGFVPTEELVTLYRESLALIMPSLFESESLPVWEAFALGCPVIASNVTALPSQISDAGLLFNPMSSDELTAQILKVYHSDQLRKQLVQAGYERRSKLTPENTAKAYFAAYAECLGDKSQSRSTSEFKF